MGALLDEGGELRDELRRRVVGRHAGGDDDRDVRLAVPRAPPLQNLRRVRVGVRDRVGVRVRRHRSRICTGFGFGFGLGLGLG